MADSKRKAMVKRMQNLKKNLEDVDTSVNPNTGQEHGSPETVREIERREKFIKHHRNT
jgi:hypothetical protein